MTKPFLFSICAYKLKLSSFSWPSDCTADPVNKWGELDLISPDIQILYLSMEPARADLNKPALFNHPVPAFSVWGKFSKAYSILRKAKLIEIEFDKRGVMRCFIWILYAFSILYYLFQRYVVSGLFTLLSTRTNAKECRGNDTFLEQVWSRRLYLISLRIFQIFKTF